MEGSIGKALDRLNRDFEGRIDDADFDRALDMARELLLAAEGEPNVPEPVLAFAQFQFARVVGAALGHYIKRGAEKCVIDRWAGLLPAGYKAAKRAVTLEPGLEPATQLLVVYEQYVGRFPNVFRTGQLTPDGVFEQFHKLLGEGDIKRHAGDYLGAVRTYDAAIEALERAGYGNDNWEATARYKIAQSIMNGCHYAEIHDGGWSERARPSAVSQPIAALAPRGLREAELAVELRPEEGSADKALALYRAWQSRAPWLFR